MSGRIPKNALEAALGNSMPRRFREFAMVPFDGEGAICVPMVAWQPAAAWATSRQPSGNRLRDRFLLLQRFDVLVTRRGTSMISTTGSNRALARLRDAMKQENVDVSEWNFPPDDLLDQALSVDPGKTAGDPAPAAEPAGAKPDGGAEPARS